MAFKVQEGYQKFTDNEPLILEPEDWTFDEWLTLCKLCGLPTMTTERIVLHADVVECYINSDAKLVNSDSGKRSFIVTEVCPHCENEIEMRWSIEANGYKAVCPVCGGRLMLCDECLHAEDCGHCDYDSETDSCKHNPAKNDLPTGEAKRVVIVVEDGIVESVYAGDGVDRTPEVAQLCYRKQLCKECMSEICIFNPEGICMFPMVSGRAPRLHDDGCFDFCYKEAEANA